MRKLKRILKEDWTSLCSVCRRNQGFNPKDDDYWLCKYGCHRLGDLSVKCKYFKRHTKYHTCKGVTKIVTRHSNGKSIKVLYKKGKFYKKEQ